MSSDFDFLDRASGPSPIDATADAAADTARQARRAADALEAYAESWQARADYLSEMQAKSFNRQLASIEKRITALQWLVAALLALLIIK